MSLEAASLSSVVPVNSMTSVSPMTLGSKPVSGIQSSRVTKLPLAKLHRRLKFMDSLSVMVRSRRRRKVKSSRK